MKKIAIIGSGSWGVALSIHLANMGHMVKIWSFAEDEAELINKKENVNFYQKLYYHKILLVIQILKR